MMGVDNTRASTCVVPPTTRTKSVVHQHNSMLHLRHNRTAGQGRKQKPTRTPRRLRPERDRVPTQTPDCSPAALPREATMPRAPRRCPGDNGNCTNLIRNTRYCPEHTTAWRGERSRSSAVTSTAAWKRLRVEVLERDNHECQAREPGCTIVATQVDHIVNTAAGGAELDPDNCQAICPPCNARKAQREGTRARNAWKRKPQRHPGLIR